MSIWASTKWPMVFAFRLLDRQIINGCVSKPHQAVIIKLPVLIAVGAEPVSRVIVPFVGETHSDAIFVGSPKLFYQPVVEFFDPLTFQKLNDFFSSIRELGAIPPARISRIGQGDLLGITGIPSVFGQTNFLNRGVASERG